LITLWQKVFGFGPKDDRVSRVHVVIEVGVVQGDASVIARMKQRRYRGCFFLSLGTLFKRTTAPVPKAPEPAGISFSAFLVKPKDRPP
jgi:hypothetical protein